MSESAALAAKPVDFQIKDYEIVGKGNILGRFDLVVAGLGTIFKCGLFRKTNGEGLFVNLPSVNVGKLDPKAKTPHIKMGSIDRDLNHVYTAAAEQEHAKAMAALTAQATTAQA